MCGIVGILGRAPVADSIVEALKRLEYRGYDSAGIATLEGGHLTRRRAEGKLKNLELRLSESPLEGVIGIGHTRWATHGRPSEANAHPHSSDRLAVVHNGIIENFRELREELRGQGYTFTTETDTEVVAHLVSAEMRKGLDPVDAVAAALPRLKGAFALAFLFDGVEDLLIGARQGPPLAVGFGIEDMYLGSDALALAPFTDVITYLEDGDWVVLRPGQAEFHDEDGNIIERVKQRTVAGALLVERGNHRHFMAKEIHEQPEVVARTLAHYLDMLQGRVHLPFEFPFDPNALDRITITACGTAYYAALTAKYWFERFARLPVEVDVASEFRYREAPLPERGLMIVVSQSGETADTRASLHYARSQKQHVLSVVNVPSSTIARESHIVAPTLAGPEIGVASTKALTCQLAVLACLALALGRARGKLSAKEEFRLVNELMLLPGLMAEVLKREVTIEAIAHSFAKVPSVLYLGRGTNYPLALEGALKLKEISYIHAEGYAAGEMKHGPIALIDENVPVVVLAPPDDLFEKTLGNIEEVMARGGRVVMVSDAAGIARFGNRLAFGIAVPTCDPFVAPLLYTIPIQLLAYHVAALKGTDVDQPRNLAKSVTVE